MNPIAVNWSSKIWITIVDKIHIEGLLIFAIIGVYDWERESPQKIVVDLTMHLPLAQASQSDDLNYTIDYAAVCASLDALAQSSQPQLLERLAGLMCDHLLQQYPISKVELKISKPDILPKTSNVAVEFVRSR